MLSLRRVTVGNVIRVVIGGGGCGGGKTLSGSANWTALSLSSENAVSEGPHAVAHIFATASGDSPGGVEVGSMDEMTKI